MQRARHKIPTGLAIEDRFIAYGALTLSLRQCFLLLGGAAVGYGGVWKALPALPLPVRLGASLAPPLAALVVAFARPGGRPPEDWLFILARYRRRPPVAVWRPPDPDPADWRPAASTWAGMDLRPAWREGARECRAGDGRP